VQKLEKHGHANSTNILRQALSPPQHPIRRLVATLWTLHFTACHILPVRRGILGTLLTRGLWLRSSHMCHSFRSPRQDVSRGGNASLSTRMLLILQHFKSILSTERCVFRYLSRRPMCPRRRGTACYTGGGAISSGTEPVERNIGTKPNKLLDRAHCSWAADTRCMKASSVLVQDCLACRSPRPRAMQTGRRASSALAPCCDQPVEAALDSIMQ
jgi:hypothetical protein